MKSEPKILITGATGAVGAEVVKQLCAIRNPSTITVLIRKSSKASRLLNKYRGINCFYGDISDYTAVEEACRDKDYIIHLAALIPPIADENRENTLRVNLDGTKNIVQALEKVSPKSFLLFSSSVAVYGDRLKNPEISVTDKVGNCHAHDFYSHSKIEAERIISESSLNWTIFRLAAIMGIGNHKVSKLIFHMPLETMMEIATVEDTARAFVNSIGKSNSLNKTVFNLGGGESCRITYFDFLSRAFHHFGMGKVDFPENAFAKANFHCGPFVDGHLLEEIIAFRKDTLETYFHQFGASVPKVQRLLTQLVNRPVKKQLLRLSEPYKAYKTQDKKMIARFFGNE